MAEIKWKSYMELGPPVYNFNTGKKCYEPELPNGAKIRLSNWNAEDYVTVKDNAADLGIGWLMLLDYGTTLDFEKGDLIEIPCWKASFISKRALGKLKIGG